MPGKFFVYAAFRPWNGQPCYIGKGGRYDRISAHIRNGEKHRNRHFANIFMKARVGGREVIFVKIREGLSESDALSIEVALIKALGRQPHGPLVNRTDGGDGNSGHRHTAETRARLKLAQKRANDDPEIRRIKSEAAKRRWANPEYRAKICALRRASHGTPEFKARMSAKKAENYTDGRLRKRISDQMLAQWKDESYRAHMVKVHKKPAKEKELI